MPIPEPFQVLADSHDYILAELSLFRQSLQSVEKLGAVGYVSEKENLRMIFSFMETGAALHLRDEEEGLFPLIQSKLVCKSAAVEVKISVEAMEEEHQLAKGALRRIKELARLIDQDPWAERVKPLLTEFVEEGYWTVQLYEGHIWKENNILFPMVRHLLTPKEIEHLADVMNENRKATTTV